MEYVIDTSNNTGLNWAAKGVERILQNVMNIFSTIKYEVAYERTLGLTGKFVDRPQQNSIAQATSEIIDQIQIWEPRAKIKDLKYTGIDTEGNMQFRVVIDIG